MTAEPRPMILGGMQPYFFPYLGYFELIRRTNFWVVCDMVQYIARGWMNRNRILHPHGSGWQYINAPLQKHHQNSLIKDVLVLQGRAWKDRLLRQLDHYRKKAPYYETVRDLVARCLAPDEPTLSRLNVHGLGVFCDYLGISFEPHFHSEMDVDLGPREGPADWAIRIAAALRADEYVNPPGGANLYDPTRFATEGIKLTFQKLVDFSYDASPYQFEPCLSIVDVCMWNSPAEIASFLDAYSLDQEAA